MDLETEVERRIIHDAVLKETGEKAFQLDTLAVTLYYPSTLPPAAPGHSQPWARPWLPQPISLIGTGYARLAGIRFAPLQSLFTFAMWLLGSGTMIPGVVDAPVLSSSEKILVDEGSGAGGLGRILNAGQKAERMELRDVTTDKQGTLPCVVFTHGMAGMSQSYSHYLGSIASHGVVVAAIEHRDGSGPGTIVHFPDGGERRVWHMKLSDLESAAPMTDADLKVAQLAFREAEIIDTLRLFRALNEGDSVALKNLKPGAPQSALPGFKDRLDLAAMTVIGHSYGATGALQAVKNAPSAAMPLNGAIALDPGKGSGPLNDEIDVPVLVMNSGQWTEKQVEFYGQGWHFDVVKKLVQDARFGWFMTLTGTAHPSCTDAPLIVPWIMRMVTGTTLDPRVALREYIDVSMEFLDFLRNGERRGVLESEVTSPNGPIGEAEKRRYRKGKGGADWEVHVVPEE